MGGYLYLLFTLCFDFFSLVFFSLHFFISPDPNAWSCDLSCRYLLKLPHLPPSRFHIFGLPIAPYLAKLFFLPDIVDPNAFFFVFVEP